MTTELSVTEGPATLVWEPATRLAVLRFTEAGVGGLTEAKRLTDQLRAWVDDGGPYRLLVDCSEIVDADAGWRNVWGEFFKGQRERAVIGWFNAGPRVQLVIVMFKKGTGVTGEAFATEAEARAYLDAADLEGLAVGPEADG